MKTRVMDVRATESSMKISIAERIRIWLLLLGNFNMIIPE
jgi:hypothetical protein